MLLSLLSIPHCFCSTHEGWRAVFVIHFLGDPWPVSRVADAGRRFPREWIRVSQPAISTIFRPRRPRASPLYRVIERFLRHCGLWEGPLRTLADPRAPPTRTEPDEHPPRELQSVLDPESP
jgi:hypothetical protein